jgi:hypothetical protein
MYGLIINKGTIIHISNRLFGLNRQCGFTGRAVLEIAKKQRSMGFDAAILAPIHKDIPRLLHCETVGQNCLKYEIEGVPVYVLKSSSCRPHPISRDKEYKHFSAAFWKMMEAKHDPLFPKVALIHGHGQAISSIFADALESSSGIKTIFTPYARDQITKDIKFSMAFADMTAVWTKGDLDHFLSSRYWNSFNAAINKGNVSILSSSNNHFKDKQFTAGDSALTQELFNNMYYAYLKTIYSSGYDLSLNIMKNEYNPSYVLVDVTERLPANVESKATILTEELQKALHIKNIMCVGKGQAIGEAGYKGTLGGIIHLFREISKLCGKDPENRGPFFGVLDAGSASRLSIVSLASGGKGRVKFLDKTFNEIMLRQQSLLAQQLPGYGKGWTVISSNDNFMIPYGPVMIGNDFLVNAKQKIIMFAKKINIRGVHRSDIHYMKDLSTILAHPSTGTLSEIQVRKKDQAGEYDMESILLKLNKMGGGEIHKGTYFFAMTNDIVRLMNKKYSVPSVKDKRPMHETYSIDFEKTFIEAAVMDKDVWMKKYSDSESIKNEFVKEDWEYLWNAADSIKESAGGIGVASLGEETIWADLGTLKEVVRVMLEIVRGRSDDIPIRKMLNIGEKASVENSYIRGVSLRPLEVTPEGAYNLFFIRDSVFLKGGKVGENCIIVNSIFEEYAQIPDNTIIIDSHIYETSGSINTKQFLGKLLYRYDPQPSAVTEFKGGIAQSTMYLKDGGQFTGLMPIRIDLDVPRLQKNGGKFMKDPVLNYYDLDGEIGESFNSLKYQVSIRKTNEAYNNHMRHLAKLLKEAGLKDPMIREQAEEEI